MENPKKISVYYIFKLIFIFFSLIHMKPFCLAQNSFILKFESENTPIKVKNIDIDSILDNRFFKGSFGIAQTGLDNKKVPIEFEDGINSIKKFLQENIQKEGTAHEKVVIAINHLWMTEESAALSEKGSCAIELLFCKKDKDGSFRSFYVFEDSIELKKGWDVTKSHQKRLRVLLRKSIELADTINLQTVASEPFKILTLDSLNSILHTQKLKAGIYRTFVDFYNNSPIATEHIQLEPLNKKKKNYKLVSTDPKERIKKYYGYCDGVNVYISSLAYKPFGANYYTKVVEFGKYMLIDDSVINPATSAALVGGFGLVGGLMSAATAPQGVAVEMRTGQPVVLSEKNFERILKENMPEYLGKYQKTNRTDFDLKQIFIRQINTLR